MAWPLILPLVLSWLPTGLPTTGRYRHTATPLRHTDPAGKAGYPDAIIVGGCSHNPVSPGCELSSTELFDQDAGAWSAGPRLTVGRYGHQTVRLRDFSLLVLGGVTTSGGVLTSDGATAAERIIPALAGGPPAHVIAGGTLHDGRINASATLLPDGSVLVVGGYRSVAGALEPVASAELWDPLSEDFAPTDPPATTRAYHTATPLPDGTVLVAGGLGPDGAALASTEIYDPSAPDGAHWRSGPTMARPRSRHVAALTGAGRAFSILVAGGLGEDFEALGDAERADVAPDGAGRAVVWPWVAVGALATPRYHAQAAQLPTGTVLVVGGIDAGNALLDSVEAYDPGAATWSDAGHLPAARGQYHAATPLAGGRVLVTGGYGAPATADLLDPCSPARCSTRLGDACLCPTACPDRDGDGLNDAWETAGLDQNGDGAIDVPAAALVPGASPTAVDLYVEIGYMVADGVTCPAPVPGIDVIRGCFAPFQRTLDTAGRVFAAQGIRLHIASLRAIPRADVTTHGGCAGIAGGAVTLADLGHRYFPDSHRGLYRRVIFADADCEGSVDPVTGDPVVGYVGGFAEVPGDDVIVGGVQAVAGGLVQTGVTKQARAFVHELGHNLGLGHSGDPDGAPSPPNYASLMGGAFDGAPDFDADEDGDIDEDGDVDAADVDSVLAAVTFSSGGLGVLDEHALRERDGGPGAALPFSVTYSCPPGVNRAPAASCSGAAGPTRRACTTLRGRSYVHLGGVDQVVQTWTVVARTANVVDWNCDGAFSGGALPPTNVNGNWTTTGVTATVSVPSCSDCLGGTCTGGACVYMSPVVTGAIYDRFPGVRDRDLMRFGFQCQATADVAGDDLPIFFAP